MKVGLIGDYRESVTAHKAIPIALELASEKVFEPVEFKWLDTTDLTLATLPGFDALWCVPASPYKNMENVLNAIRYAREEDVPFLGTCGGYQHAALEFAQNELGYSEAGNVEVNADTSMPLISGLSCKLYDEKANINLIPDSNLAEIYGSDTITEEYFCGFGVNREYLPIFAATDMHFSGFDADGDPRCLEISRNRFFVGTAFQPERSALAGLSHPLICAYLSAAKNA